MVNNSINNELLQGLGRELARLLSTGKSGLNDYRQKRWADVLAQGIPPGAGRSGKVIDWQGLTNQSFELAGAQVGRGAIDCSDHVLPDAANLVLVNGFFSPGLSDRMALPSGVSVKPLENLIVTEAEAIPQRLNATIVVPNNPFVALADTFIQGGIELCVGANTVCPRLIHIVHIAADSSKPVLSAPRIFVVLEKEAQVDLLVSFVSSSDNAVNWTNAVIDIDMAEGSRCQLFDAQYENVKSYHACTTRVRQCHGSEFSSCVVTVGGAVSRNDVVVELGGEGTSTGLHGIYSITDRQQVDQRTLVRHLHPEGMSRQLYNGILAKSAQAVFNGKIYVHPTAQGTNAYQLNKNLLLGKDSRAQSKPQLEIFADDVKCSHGVTVGQLNEDEILYLQMRGISRTDAGRMLIEGAVEDALSPVAIEPVRQRLVGLLLPTIAAALCEERL